MKGGGGNFLVKPRPDYLKDIILSKEKISKFMLGVLLNSTNVCNISANIAYSIHNSFFARHRNSTLQPDCFVTSLLYHANNTDVTSCSVIADMPELVFRDNIARTVELEDISQYFDQYLIEIEDKNSSFDPKTLNPEVMVKPKADYMAEVMKQTSFIHKMIVAVVEYQMAFDIEESWKLLNNEPRPLKDFLKITNKGVECSLIEYTEKHVLLDLMMGPLIHEYFVKFGVFPYSAHGMVGVQDGFYDNVRDSWNYYYSSHSNKFGSIIDSLISSSHAKGKTDPKDKKNSKKTIRKPEKK